MRVLHSERKIKKQLTMKVINARKANADSSRTFAMSFKEGHNIVMKELKELIEEGHVTDSPSNDVITGKSGDVSAASATKHLYVQDQNDI